MDKRAKLFWNGRSQAVRLPKEFRFEGTEVVIRREADRVILEPVTKVWDDVFWGCFGALSDDVDRGEQGPDQPRSELFS